MIGLHQLARLPTTIRLPSPKIAANPIAELIVVPVMRAGSRLLQCLLISLPRYREGKIARIKLVSLHALPKDSIERSRSKRSSLEKSKPLVRRAPGICRLEPGFGMAKVLLTRKGEAWSCRPRRIQRQDRRAPRDRIN
jgi:hypothetical protein